MPPKIILGIDPGYGRCGFGVIQGAGQDWCCVTHGVITTKAGVDHQLRLAEIASDIRQLVAEHQPHLIALEELFFVQSKTTGLKVAEVRGMIKLIVVESGLELVEVKPTEVKMALTGYGRADKTQIQEMVKSAFGLSAIPQPDDAADALAIALTAATKARFS